MDLGRHGGRRMQLLLLLLQLLLLGTFVVAARSSSRVDVHGGDIVRTRFCLLLLLLRFACLVFPSLCGG
jgi:hypothetical protein